METIEEIGEILLSLIVGGLVVMGIVAGVYRLLCLVLMKILIKEWRNK